MLLLVLLLSPPNGAFSVTSFYTFPSSGELEGARLALTLSFPLLYCIHEVALDAVEDDDGEEEGDAHEDGAVEKAAPVEGSTAHAAVLEGLEDGGEGVEGDDVLVFAGGCAQWIDNGGGVHEELDAEANELAQVTVLGGHRRDDHAP